MSGGVLFQFAVCQRYNVITNNSALMLEYFERSMRLESTEFVVVELRSRNYKADLPK